MKDCALTGESPARRPRVVALLATRNEIRFVASCIESLVNQGVEVYLIDNGSTDETLEAALAYRGAGLIGWESFPHDGIYRWRQILERKDELAASIQADWIMHVDADEIHSSPWPGITLADALARVQAAGFNAVNFEEFTFIPTREEPDHDHSRFRWTMRSYYPFRPIPLHLVRGWMRQPSSVGLATIGGHRPYFPGLRVYPERFVLQHYLFLSVGHLLEKYGSRHFDPDELDRGWHGWRASTSSGRIVLPPKRLLREMADPSDLSNLDATAPWKRHWLDLVFAGEESSAGFSPANVQTG